MLAYILQLKISNNGKQETWGSLSHHSSTTHSSAWSSLRTLKHPRKPCCQKALQNLSEVLAARGKAKGLSEGIPSTHENRVGIFPHTGHLLQACRNVLVIHVWWSPACKENLTGERDTRVHCREGKYLYNSPKKTNVLHNHSCKNEWESLWGGRIKTVTPSHSTHHHFCTHVIKAVTYPHPCFRKQLCGGVLCDEASQAASGETSRRVLSSKAYPFFSGKEEI